MKIQPVNIVATTAAVHGCGVIACYRQRFVVFATIWHLQSGVCENTGMNEEADGREEFNWRLPIHTIAATSALLLLLFLWSPDADSLYIFIVAPIACLVWLGLIIASAVRRKFQRSLGMLLTLILFSLVSGTLLANEAALRPRLRWLLFARYFKAQVISQPIPANGELKHVEWDGWGGAPVGDWTA